MGYRYTWQGDSPITQIDVRKSAAGWLQVVIYAPQTTNTHWLDLPDYLKQHKITCYLDEVDEKDVMKIADIGKKDDEFLDLLHSGGFTSGSPSKAEIPDEAPKLGTIARIRKNSMNISGIFGEIGHIATIILGWLTKDPDTGKRDTKRMAVGLLYGTATALPAFFGTGAGAIRFSEIVDGLRAYLGKEGFNIAPPSIETPQTKFRNRSVLTRFWDSVKSHPVQTQNMIALPGNILLTIIGWNERKKNQGKTGTGLIVSGVFAAISSLIAIIVPEATPEKIAEFNKKKGLRQTLGEEGWWATIKMIPDAIYMSISRMPLVFYGGLLAIDNVLGIDREAYDVIKDYKRNKNTPEQIPFHKPLLTTIQAAGWTLASTTGTLGSQKRDKSLETRAAYDGLYAQTANLLLSLIMNSSESVQRDIIKKSAEYLAAEPDVHVHASEIEKELTDKIRILKKNPWAPKVVSSEEENKNAYVQAGLDQLQAFANDPTNAIPRNGLTKIQPAVSPLGANGSVSSPNPAMDSVTAGTPLEQQQVGV